ncbi:alpha/beta fold hydrolase [Halomonas sp. CKK8]|uniref:alpha/beta fold hydrolase n=1 Tax=Halomonas sp. CKK8 TaxID=3036127 RepID=UPI0024155BF1|nr:alpha/beta fold hydrolase [Halomonas sp. CKK8]WFM72806.1 alpha/beta fold hydrolase [Halomonas sp. CKK8]
MPVIDNQGVAIVFEEAGAGLPIVLLHSFLGSGEIWRAQVPVLAAQHRVINVDVRGHGRSGHLTELFTLYDAVDDVIAVLDALGIERAVWCGLSIGGMVALRGAIRHPQRVAGLILMDTDAGAETAWHRVKYRAMGIVVRVFGFRPLLPFVTRLMFGTTTRRDDPALVSETRAMIARNHVPSALRCLEALTRRDSVVERLHEIDVPALVMVGEEDRMLPPRLSRRIQEGLVDASLTTIPGAGHLTPLEQPERVNATVLAFLATLSPPRPRE